MKKETSFNKILNISLGLRAIKSTLNERELGGIMVSGDQNITDIINHLLDEIKYFVDAWYNQEEV